MSRLSLRVLWTAARSGLLLSLLICAGSSTSSLLAQQDYAAMDAARMAAMSGGPMTGAQQAGTLTNRASGIKRTENSLGRLQALLYSDASVALRINLNKIDYEGLADFVDEVVDKAGGAVRSSDQYRVDLREYQKANAKSSFRDLLLTIQNTLVNKAFGRKIDELYYIFYCDGSEPGCGILALPVDGLSAEDQNRVVDTFSSTSIAVFKRFGFIIAVTRHDNAVEADLDSIEAKYRAKTLEAQKTASAYGSYSASSASGSSNYGAYGGSSSSPMTGGMNTAGLGATNTDAAASLTGISSELVTDYLKEIETAEKEARTASRQAVLPFIRTRFSTPASAEDAKNLAEALRQTDGAAFTFTFKSIDELQKFYGKTADGNDDDEIAQPFAGLGTDTTTVDAEDPLALVASSLKEQDSFNTVKNFTFAVSLVGSPKFVFFATFANNEDSKLFADVFTGALTMAQPIVKDTLDKQLAEVSDESVDYAPFVRDVFKSLKPQSQNNKVAVVVDLDLLKQNASL